MATDPPVPPIEGPYHWPEARGYVRGNPLSHRPLALHVPQVLINPLSPSNYPFNPLTPPSNPFNPLTPSVHVFPDMLTTARTSPSPWDLWAGSCHRWRRWWAWPEEIWTLWCSGWPISAASKTTSTNTVGSSRLATHPTTTPTYLYLGPHLTIDLLYFRIWNRLWWTLTFLNITKCWLSKLKPFIIKL